MTRFFSKLLNIRSHEWPRFLLLYSVLFLIFAGLIWGGTIVEASFLQQVGIDALPIFFIVKALVSIPAVAVYFAFADRVANNKLLIAIMLISIGVIGIGLLLIGRGLITVAFPLLYLLIFVPLDDILFTHWYTYVNDFYDTRAAKRIVPVLATAGGIAGIFAGLTISLLNRFLQPTAVITIWAGTLIAAVIMVWLAPRLLKGDLGPAEPAVIGVAGEAFSYLDNLKEGYRYVTQSSFLRWMALSTLLLMILLALLEYRTGQVLLAELGSVQEMSNFFGLLTGVANLIILPIQLFFFSRIIGRLGLGNTNLIFPIGTAATVSSLVFLPGKISGALAYITRMDFYNNFGYLTNSLLYNAVPLRVKGRARAFVGGFVVPIGALIGGILLLMPGGVLERYLPSLLALLSVAVVLTAVILRKEYGQALITMLEEEDFSSLMSQEASDLTVTDPAALRSLAQKLEESTSPELTIFMARLISDIGGNAAVPIMDKVVREGDPGIRSIIVDILVAADMRGGAIGQLYRDLLADPNPAVRQSALEGLALLEGADSKAYLSLAQQMLTDPSIAVRARVLPALLRAGEPYAGPAQEALAIILACQRPDERAQGVGVLGELGDSEALQRLLTFAEDPADEVRLEAALAIETLTEAGLPAEMVAPVREQIARLQNDPIERVRQVMLLVLGRIGDRDSHKVVANALNDSSAQVRATAVDVLADIGKAAIPTIHPQLDSPDPQLRKMTVVILSRINKREFSPLITAHITGNLLNIYRNYGHSHALDACNRYPSVAILQSTFREQSRQLTDELFYLLTAVHEPDSINLITQSLRSEDGRVRANALEALESLTTPQTAMLIAPLLEPEPAVDTLLKLCLETWEMTVPDPADLMRQSITNPDDPWLRAIATFALGELSGGAKAANGKTDGDARMTADSTPKTAARRRRPNPLDKLTGSSPAGDAAEPAPETPRPARRRRRPPADLFGSLLDQPAASDKEAAANKSADSLDSRAANRHNRTGDGTVSTPSAPVLFTPEEVEKLLAASLADSVEEVRLAARAVNRMISGRSMHEWFTKEEAVLSAIEKIIFLKEVPFFSGMTVDQLKVLANVCEEEFFNEESRIYHEGDPGGVLYVVVSGRVGIEQEKRKGSFARLATLGPHTYFGEMNIFDNSLRSASAIALQDTLTLRLRREPLIALARQYPNLSLELINVLSARLRETSDQIADLTRTRPRELHKLFDQFE